MLVVQYQRECNLLILIKKYEYSTYLMVGQSIAQDSDQIRICLTAYLLLETGFD